VLIRAGRAARDWINRAGDDPHNPAGFLVAACLWREQTAHRPIPLPFSSAPELLHHRLGLRIGLDWKAQFLETVTAAAMTGLRELNRLLETEKKCLDIRVTARSRLPEALDALLRAPVVTADSLAKALQVTPRAALGLLQQLMAAGSSGRQPGVPHGGLSCWGNSSWSTTSIVSLRKGGSRKVVRIWPCDHQAVQSGHRWRPLQKDQRRLPDNSAV
jgi:hypothetical protein